MTRDKLNDYFSKSRLAGVAALVVGLAGCQAFTKFKNSVTETVASYPPVVKESESGEVYPNVRFQSPDQGSGVQNRTPDRLRQTFGRNELDSNLTQGAQIQDKADRSQLVSNLTIEGNERLATHQILRYVSTRPGRYFDPDRLQADIDKIWRLPQVRRIKGPYLKKTPDGVDITIVVEERNTVGEVKFIGNRQITDRALIRETGLKDGEPLDRHAIKMAKTKIEEYYKEKGFPKTQVEIVEGDEETHNNIVFLIHEDQQQRVWGVEFVGNTFASSARLRHFIKSKPGVLKVFGGLVKRDEIEQDILRLSNYYRKFGFFNAQIGREIVESNDGRWLTLRFIINEGPRYRVRNVSFLGNKHYPTGELNKLLQLKPGASEQPEYNVGMLNEDVVALRDLYGSQGFVFAKIDAEPRFLEEPGLMDIVYKISEGKQYRVGNINVKIAGDYGVTKREVALNRISLRPGDLIDVRKLRDSKRRLRSARIFAGEAGSGPPPDIVVLPRELKAIERMASTPYSSSSRSSVGSGSGSRY